MFKFKQELNQSHFNHARKCEPLVWHSDSFTLHSHTYLQPGLLWIEPNSLPCSHTDNSWFNLHLLKKANSTQFTEWKLDQYFLFYQNFNPGWFQSTWVRSCVRMGCKICYNMLASWIDLNFSNHYCWLRWKAGLTTLYSQLKKHYNIIFKKY